MPRIAADLRESAAAHSRDQALLDDRWIHENWCVLLKDHLNSYVAVLNGKVVSSAGRLPELVARLRELGTLQQAVISYIEDSGPRIEW